MDCILQLVVPAGVPEAAVLEAVDGGVDLVQFRDKEGPTERRIAAFASLATRLRGRQIRTIVNDDIEAARALEADGVHLGQTDASPARARVRLGASAWIGLSTHGAEEIRAAGPEVTHFGLGACFPSSTKLDTRALEPAVLRAALVASSRPVFAIGGIDVAGLEALVEQGVRRIAVSSAVLRASRPDVAAGRLRALLDRASSRP